MTNEPSAASCHACGASFARPRVIVRGTVLAARYEIIDTLGHGGMGTVYKARDVLLDETVAIKTLRADMASDPEVARRFVSEIKLARKVRHENVCGIHEYGEDGATRFIAMEFVDGVDLRHVVRQNGQLPPGEAFNVALQVARGLQAIHECGIIHRDLKTSNLMLDANGTVRVMDFGIAKQSGSDSTLAGMVLGTPEYMSPEQAQGRRIDFRSDLYALGIVIWEIFSGRPPFRGDTMLSVIMKQIHDPPPLESEEARHLPPPLLPVLSRALEKEPAARFADAAGFAAALERARAEWAARAEDTVLAGGAPVAEEPSPTIVAADPAAPTRLSQLPTVMADRATELATLDRPGTPPPTRGPQRTQLQQPAHPQPHPAQARAPLRATGARRAAPWRVAGIAGAVVLAAFVVVAVVLLGHRRPQTSERAVVAPATVTPVPGPTVAPVPGPTVARPDEPEHVAPRRSAAADGSVAPTARQPTRTQRPVPPEREEAPPPQAPRPQGPPPAAPEPAPTMRPAVAPVGPMALPPGAPRPVADPRNKRPMYPRAAFDAGLEGTVLLKLLVSETGEVLNAEPLAGEEPFAQAALEAARGWRYQPVVIDGAPRSVYFVVPIPFRLPKSGAAPPR